MREQWAIRYWNWNGTEYVPERFVWDDSDEAEDAFSRWNVSKDVPQVDLYHEKVNKYGCIVWDELVARKD